MPGALQIQLQGISPSEALQERIRAFAAKLDRLHPRITSCRVAIDETGLHQQQGRQFHVRVEVRAPGHAEAIATLHHDADVYVALHEAFDAVHRQLDKARAASA